MMSTAIGGPWILPGAQCRFRGLRLWMSPASRTHVQGTLFDPVKSHSDDFRTRLIWGNNKLVMASLLKEFKGKIDLIYIDPPFDVGADFLTKTLLSRYFLVKKADGQVCS